MPSFKLAVDWMADRMLIWKRFSACDCYILIVTLTPLRNDNTIITTIVLLRIVCLGLLLRVSRCIEILVQASRL